MRKALSEDQSVGERGRGVKSTVKAAGQGMGAEFRRMSNCWGRWKTLRTKKFKKRK